MSQCHTYVTVQKLDIFRKMLYNVVKRANLLACDDVYNLERRFYMSRKLFARMVVVLLIVGVLVSLLPLTALAAPPVARSDRRVRRAPPPR